MNSLFPLKMAYSSVIRAEHRKMDSYWSWMVRDVVGLVVIYLKESLLEVETEQIGGELKIQINQWSLGLHDQVIHLHQRADGRIISIVQRLTGYAIYQEYDSVGNILYTRQLDQFSGRHMCYPIDSGILYWTYPELKRYRLMFLQDQPIPEEIGTMLTYRICCFNATHYYTNNDCLVNFSTQQTTSFASYLRKEMDDSYLYLLNVRQIVVVDLSTQTILRTIQRTGELFVKQFIWQEFILYWQEGPTQLRTLDNQRILRTFSSLKNQRDEGSSDRQIYFYRRNGRIYLVGAGPHYYDRTYLQTFTFLQ